MPWRDPQKVPDRLGPGREEAENRTVDTLSHACASGIAVTRPQSTVVQPNHKLTFSSKVNATRGGYSLSAMTTPARQSFRT